MLQAVGARLLPPSATGRASRLTLLFALFAVYALDRADRTLVGAVAPSLKHDFSLSNTDIGLLGTAYTLVSALATIPAGVLTDRVPRVRLLAVALVLWSVAMVSTGAAVTFAMLFASRAFLGIVQAVAGPVVPSLIGDSVGGAGRSRAMSLVDSGQLVGLGLGYVVAGVFSAAFGWRAAFLALAPLAALLALRLWHTNEPRRSARGDGHAALSLWRAAGAVLRVRTNVLAIFSSAVSQYFFAGLSTFAVIYVTEQYRISQSEADLGLPLLAVAALGGMFGGGRLADLIRARGHPTARLWIAATSSILAALFALPAILTRSLLLAVPAIMLGVFFLNAATPTLDALRLDVIPPRLRGRSESIRTLVLIGFEGSAPLVFGYLADHLSGGGRPGLETSFLVTLPAVALSGVLIAAAAPFYAREAQAESAGDLQADDVPGPPHRVAPGAG